VFWRHSFGKEVLRFAPVLSHTSSKHPRWVSTALLTRPWGHNGFCGAGTYVEQPEPRPRSKPSASLLHTPLLGQDRCRMVLRH
jgi:hypothetical protein